MAAIRIGLGKQSLAVTDDDVRKLAAALEIQAKRDLKLVWDVDADVILLDDPRKPPSGVWPIFIVDATPHDLAGIHSLSVNTLHPELPRVPCAWVSTKRDWQLAASHELIEMLVDPTGSKTVPSRGLALDGDQVRELDTNFEYLLEACDPIEDDDHAYEIDGILVSDFYTPNYFDPEFIAGRRYSFNGAISRPREVGPGGYLTWRNPASSKWQQLRNFAGYTLVDLPINGWDDLSRNAVDQITPTPRLFPHLFPPRPTP